MHKIMLIGEAYGETEEKEGKPFVGQSGRVLDAMLEEAGIARDTCYITNVVNKRPPNNNFKVYYEKGQPTGELLQEIERLKLEIASVRPNVIVTLGAEALRALTGLSGITDWRGSILETPYGKVIPTIHPALVLRDWSYRPAVVSDLSKALTESGHSEVMLTPRELIINPTFEEVMYEIEEAKKCEWVAFDIEVETEQITCISLSYRLHRAVCIPFWFGASGSIWSHEQETQIWTALRGLLESDTPKKIAHNGSYDVEYLESTLGITTKLHLDTMLGFHTLYPELPKGLDYLVSLYTDHPYYKYQRRTHQMDDYWRYNATDSCLTFECAQRIREELLESKLVGFYSSTVHSLIEPLHRMQRRGVRFDVNRRDVLRKQTRMEVANLKQTLERQVGHPLNTASSAQMKKWLYEELKLPKVMKLRKDTGERTESADEEALNDCYIKCTLPEAKEAIKTVLAIREKEKLLSTYLEVKLDRDERIRCNYLISGTETGRLSSRATSRGTGTNLQNIPNGEFKKLFIADEGKVLINADLSQAEARVVAYLSGESRLIKVFEEGGDVHKKNAANIFKVREEEVTDEQRQLAKRVVHASNYGMGPVTFSKTAGIPKTTAEQLLNQYFATYPGIKRWHMQVAASLRKTRTMHTPLGRRRIFFNRWGDSVVKEALAYVPQSTVADIVNQALVCMDKLGLELLLQVHDSVVVQCEESKVKETVELMRGCMTRAVEVGGKFLVVPVDFKVGKNWGELNKV